MWALWLVSLLARPAPDAALSCGPDAPAVHAVSHGRDPDAIERVVLREEVPDTVPADRASALWLVYPGFKPFPAAIGAFRDEVQTPAGTFSLCLPPSVAARQQRPAAPAQVALEGGLVLLSFDPSRPGTPRFPLDPAFDVARRRQLLTTEQSARLAELERLLPRRADALVSAWNDFRQSPRLGPFRVRLFEALRAFQDPRPAFTKDALEPRRFFSREQREALRREGRAIPGRCTLIFTPRGGRLELDACPLGQLASEWNRLRAEAAPGSPALRAVPARQHEEVDRLVLELEGVPREVVARRVLALLSSIEGLERE